MDHICDNENCENEIDLLDSDHIEIDLKPPPGEEMLEYYYCSANCAKEDIIKELDAIGE